MRTKVKPYRWQLEELEAHGRDEARAILWEMRLGKTKLMLDTATLLYDAGEIDGLLVLAPNGVHAGWVREAADNIPDDVCAEALAWRASAAKTQRFRERFQEVLKTPGLAILSMNYDASITKAGRAALKYFTEKRRIMTVLDESQMIKTPSVGRTFVALAAGRRSAYRRILTGTLTPNKPWDAFTQYKFLDPDLWKKNGIRTYTSMKSRFGIWELAERRDGRQYPNLLGLRDVGSLWPMIVPVSNRLTLADIGEELPEVRQAIEFEMPSAWRRHYAELKQKFRTELESGEVVTAAHALARMTRLQQVSCGHLPGGALPGPNPRAALAADIVQGSPGQALVWCRFRHDVDAVMAELAKRKIAVVRYDGAVGVDERAQGLQRFQDGAARAFVGNPQAGGRGLTLPCPTVVWYSSSYNLEERLQATARARKIGGAGIHIVDLVAEGTLDRKILETLEQKCNVAATVTGDTLRTWLASG